MGKESVNRAARALGKLRAKDADMAAVGRLGGIAARGKSGRPAIQDRCKCGAMTRERAKKRNHKC